MANAFVSEVEPVSLSHFPIEDHETHDLLNGNGAEAGLVNQTPKLLVDLSRRLSGLRRHKNLDVLCFMQRHIDAVFLRVRHIQWAFDVPG